MLISFTSPVPPLVDKPHASTTPIETPDITLTDEEEAKVIEIALNYPSVSEWLKGKNEYRVAEVRFFYVWDGGYSSQRSKIVPADAHIYPAVTISIGEEWIEQCQVFVDLQEEKVILVDGPYTSPSSPGRFKDLEPRGH